MHIFIAYYFEHTKTRYRKFFPNKVVNTRGFKNETIKCNQLNISDIVAELKKVYGYSEVTILSVLPLNNGADNV